MKPYHIFLALIIAVASFTALPSVSQAVLLTADLSTGSRGAEVTQLQLILFQFGYSSAAPTGTYTEETAKGVRALQAKYGIEQTGTVGVRVRAVLNPFISRNPVSGSVRTTPSASVGTSVSAGTGSALAVGARGTAVTELQQKLLALGYFNETPTGYFGPITRAAVAAYQAANNLEAVGYVGPRTRALLAAAPGAATVSTTGTSVTSAVAASAPARAASPTLSLQASHSSAPTNTIIRLIWTATNATTCTAGNGWSGDRQTSGNEPITLSSNTTYALVCTGPGGSVSKSITVKITAQEEDPVDEVDAPTLTFTSDKAIVESGASVKLSWKARDADSCTATGDWSGLKSRDDDETITNITSAKSFTLSCVGEGGSITRSVFVALPVVVTPTPTPTPTPVPTPTPTPTPTPIPTPLPGPSKNYSVYPGCEAPSKSYARVIYVDPKNGTALGTGTASLPFNTLQSALDRKLINPGDHIVLLPGNHGKIQIDTNYKHSYLAGAANWTWLDSQRGAIINSIDTRGAKRWLITNAEFKGGGGLNLVSLSSGSDFVIADSELYTAKSASGWSVSDWVDGTANGAFARNTRCVAFLDNEIENVRFGITLSTDGLPDNDNGAKALVQDNEIIGFSADGMRPNASDVIVRGNRIIEAMVSIADGDNNHDDGIQFFPQRNETVFRNILLENNWIQETTSSTRPLIGGLQGIGHFDGPIEDITIRNNVIIMSAYWGIAGSAQKNALIERNTVINSGVGTNKVRIGVNASKSDEGGRVAQNVTVRDNITTVVIKNAGALNVTDTNNYLVTNQEADYANMFTTYDPANGVFDLRPKAGGLLGGRNVGASGLSSGIGSQASVGGAFGQVAGASLSRSEIDAQIETMYQMLREILNSLR